MWSDTETSIPNFSKVIILPYERMRSDTVEYSELLPESRGTLYARYFDT